MNHGIINTQETSAVRTRAVLLLLATAVLWSSAGVFIKLINWNPLAIAGIRSAIASLFVLACIGGRPRSPFTPLRFACAASYATTVILFVIATRLTTAANAILLQYTAPVYVAIFGWYFLRERLALFDGLTIALVLGSMALFFMDKLTAGGFTGNMCAIGSGFAFAVMIVLLRKQKDAHPIQSVFWGNILSAAVCLPFMLQNVPGDRTSIFAIVLSGTLQLGLSYVLYTKAIKQVSALDAILIPTIEPVLNPLWAFIFLGELPGRWALAGGAIIIGTVMWRGIRSIQTTAGDAHKIVPEIKAQSSAGLKAP